MFLIANLLVSAAQVLDYVLWAYAWILLGRVVISYVNADPNNPFIRFLYAVTEREFIIDDHDCTHDPF